MEGYSVDEAAAVLGVPQARVWELLARGILGGAERSGDMRVFLKTEAPQAARDSGGGPNGGNSGNGHGFEMSAFRELLTEFRNLTERYGQALLALGEARGEVAVLRGRVELLETRFDRGLTSALAPAGYYQTDELVAAPEATAESPAEAAPPKPRSRPKTRTRRSRPTLDEALARAEDPTSGVLPGGDAGELPGAREAAAALAELRGDQPSVDPLPAAWEPSESPPAALVEGPYSAVVEEPDWIAEDDLLVLSEPLAEEWAEPVGVVMPVDGEDEFETASATYQTAVPPLPPMFGEGSAADLTDADPLTQVAASQGWAADEVEAMRQLLAADANAAPASEPTGPASEGAPLAADTAAVEIAEPETASAEESEPETEIAPAAPASPAAARPRQVAPPPPAPRPAVMPGRPRRTAGQRAARRLRRLFGG